MNMKRKRLIETLAIQIAVPDNSDSILLDNMLSQWGSTRYAQLSVLLVHLRFAYNAHQTHHWVSRGDTFYGDHLLFQRLYETVEPEIDRLAEKAIGLGGIDCVDFRLQMQQIGALSRDYGAAATMPTASDLSRRSFAIEVAVLRCLAHCAESLKDMGLLTRGLDNMLAGFEDAHEGSVYLLKQRCESVL